ncbi:hypothetical protein, partial [Flavobacterium sp.]|uniref:hypothetical protein n=1 Tax=Flavobacterium sp. TaxID=239 RepID=UPI000EC4662F
NGTEISILKTLNNSDKDFKNKIITFISGSAGTTISKKKYFFESFKNYYLQNDVFQFTIIELDEKERLLSGSDFLIFYWVKFFNSKSKSLLKKIKKYNQTQ